MDQINDLAVNERWRNAAHWCFACGKENPIGLHLKFEPVEGGARAVFIPRPEHQGWDGVVHGGLIFTLLDEALAYAALFAHGPAMTAEFRVRMRQPGKIGHEIIAFGWVTSARRRLVETKATLSSVDGIIAEADAKFLLIPDEVL